MKKISLFCLVLACIGLESCDKNKKAAEAQAKAEKPLQIQCYRSIYEQDSIELKINTFEGDKVKGDMVMKVFDRPEKIGKIEGKFRGDTLFVDYSFIQGKNDKVVFKNPMALLKRGDELILGNGKIETYLGTSYFVKGQPIDFDKVKYKFSTIDCVDK